MFKRLKELSGRITRSLHDCLKRGSILKYGTLRKQDTNGIVSASKILDILSKKW